MKSLRHLPSVDSLLQMEPAATLVAQCGRPLTVEAIRLALEEARGDYRQGSTIPIPQKLLKRAGELIEEWTAPSLLPIINATGVIIHTNLGRAPLSRAARRAMQTIAEGYSNLEYDISRGRRGSRHIHAEAIIRRLTGAEAALVVNNNAAAVLLALSALARRRRVVISRTQLIEIGGGFRIPDVMKQSGTILVEIGTTNRVHLRDYQKAIREQPIRLLFTAHRSNFRLSGFTGEPSRGELAALAHEHGIPMVEDLGSGTLLDTAAYGLEHEPTVQETLQTGVDLVTFSGDKLLGGPQAGILAGRADLIARCKKNPLARATRADKLTYAALGATLLHYLKDEPEIEIPIWQMISASPEALYGRALEWAGRLKRAGTADDKIDLRPGESTVGGGSLPGQVLPTTLLSLQVDSPQRYLARLRLGYPAIIARAEKDRVVLDPRTVLPEQDSALLARILDTT